MIAKQLDLLQLMDQFHSEEACRDALANLRWPKGVTCPRCEGDRHAYDSERFVWDCYSCGYQFSAMSGTIFHDTKLPLRKWFLATLLMCESKKGISAMQIKRTLGISYKTAWYLCHRIRAAMADGPQEKLSGTVEVDETYIGGKVRGRGHGYRGNKTIVAGIVQRHGSVRMEVIQQANRTTLHGFIKKHTADDTEAIYTDEHPAYPGIGDRNTVHDSVNHSREEWVRGKVHTNTAESVWSLLDRSIIGAYHHVSAKHLDSYCGELEWRLNNRGNPYLFRDTLVRLLAPGNLEYRQLVEH